MAEEVKVTAAAEEKAPAKKPAAKKTAVKPAAEKKPAAKKTAATKEGAEKMAPAKKAAPKAAAEKKEAPAAEKAALSTKKAPAKAKAAEGLAIMLVKSLIGRSDCQIATAKSLGLKRVGDKTVQPDNAATKGKISKISHMVKVTKA